MPVTELTTRDDISAKDLEERILKLKGERDAVILAHNYQIGEVQDIADFVGDSLGLSRTAATVDAKTIVFCGVHFMAETAAILAPQKTILLPDLNAGCAMANMLSVREFRKVKEKYPDAVTVCYVNSTAAIKAESDYCCTSANAIHVMGCIDPDREILFVPDKYLGSYVASQTNRVIHLWPGYCPTHRRILPENIEELKAKHPQAVVMVHPECTPETIALADHVLSTGGMVRLAGESDAQEFIVGTEIGLLHRLRKENPEKTFHPASVLADCANMKLINLEKILWSLEDMEYRVEVPEAIAQRAKLAVDRMLECQVPK